MQRMLSIVCSLFLIASPCWGAIAEVGAGSQRASSGKQSSVDSYSKAYPANVTANDLLTTCGIVYTGITSVVVTDTISTNYTVYLGPDTGTGSKPFIAFGVAPSSGANTVAVNPNGASATLAYSIDEFSGTSVSAPLDVDGSSSTGNSTTPSDALTTLTANDLILGVAAIGSGGAITISVGSGYTQIGEDENSITGYNCEFKIATTATSYTMDWTVGSNLWAVYTLGFKVPSVIRRPIAPLVFQ